MTVYFGFSSSPLKSSITSSYKLEDVSSSLTRSRQFFLWVEERDLEKPKYTCKSRNTLRKCRNTPQYPCFKLFPCLLSSPVDYKCKIEKTKTTKSEQHTLEIQVELLG